MNKKIIKLISCLIPSKAKRREFRTKSIPKPPTSITENKRTNNKAVIVYPDGREENITYIEGLNIHFIGDNNFFKLYTPLPTFKNVRINMGNNSLFVMQSSHYIVQNLTVWEMRNNSVIEIGSNFSCNGVLFAMDGEDDLKVKIGNNCMFANDIKIMPTDVHSIIDVNTNLPINFGGDIEIGNSVWICPNVSILKKSKIPNNCVVGSYSIVNKKLEYANSLYAGMPARCIKQNITWERCSAQDYVRYNI